jgi:phospholipid-binding lipoprotein MlaA
MLPVLGPSNARDAVGTAVDFALDPLAYLGGAAILYARIATGGAKVVDTRAEHLRDLDALEQSSLDFYAALRSAYRQHREAEIRNKARRRRCRGDARVCRQRLVTAGKPKEYSRC